MYATQENHHGKSIVPVTREVSQNASHEPHEDLSAAAPRSPEQRKRAGRKAWIILAAIGLGAGVAAAASTYPRLGVSQTLAETTHKIDAARRSVTIVSPSIAKNSGDVRLPGSTSPLQETVIYARTSGYIATLNADIGDRVKAGQLLATIASPDVDQQLTEARARREEASANVELAKARLNRTSAASTRGAASTQQVDDAQALYNTQLAAERVSEAVVSRLETDQSYQKVVAPFDGVITRRSIDRGSLITSGSGTNVTSLFELQQQSTMRVFVDVPQSWSRVMTPGTTASVELREFPDEQFAAKVVRTSGALDRQTRTLRTELHIPNTDGRLIAGMYAQVKLSLDKAPKSLTIPASTLVIDSAGVNVVAVDGESRLARIPIKLGRDFGRDVEVVSGVSADMQMVVSPRDDLRAGEVVTVLNPTPQAVASR